MNEVSMQVAGETLELHSERALYWRRERCLLVADVHLGKGAVLRRAGVSVPTGQTATDLARLAVLIDLYQPQRLIVLGDLVHGDATAQAPWLRQVGEWRRRHAAVQMTLVAGNHDRHFDARSLGFDLAGEALQLPPFTLLHAPATRADSYVLAGHVHPGIIVHDGWRRHRLPAFRFAAHCGLLPAFGTLTGLHDERVLADERIVAISPGGLIPLT
ncbi:MAG: ligase-associated DNA damage response endonuclease PdeM [Rhodanobacter sp.]